MGQETNAESPCIHTIMIDTLATVQHDFISEALSSLTWVVMTMHACRQKLPELSRGVDNNGGCRIL